MPWKLVFKNLSRHWLRSLLTIGALAVALFLLCALRALVWALDAGVRESASDRLIVQSQVSLFVSLPLSYQGKVREVPGVKDISRWQWFGGYYQDPSNFFAQFGADPESFLRMYTEIDIVEGSAETFIKERQACLIGVDTAAKYGFKVGQNVPIVGALFPRNDGQPWQFKVAGLYRSRKKNVDNNTLFFHHEYLQKSIESGEASGPDGVSVYLVALEPGADRVAVASAIDAHFANGPQRTLTNTEAEFQAQFVSMLGGLPQFMGAIGGAVMVAILLATLNTMLIAGRQQTRDAGVLKALGFGDGVVFQVLLFQSMLLCLIGGGLGIVSAKLIEPVFVALFGNWFPGFEVTNTIMILGLVLSIALGLVAGLFPAWRASRLEAVQALRSTV